MDSETSATLASSTPIDPPLNELLVRRFGIRVQPSRAVIPNFGGFASFLKGRARLKFYRFWVNELLDDDLAERFPLETAYPDRIPPTLAFTEALVNRHREQPESRAYLFALNLLAVYALGWMPEKPLYPLGPWEATAKRARKAQEILVFDLFKGGIDAVAKRVYWLKVEGDGKIRWEPRWRVPDVGEEDVQQQAYILAMKLISGEAIEDMAQNVARAETWDKRTDPTSDPLEFRLTRWLQEAYKRMRRDGGAAILAPDEQGVGALMDKGAHFIIFPLAGSVALLMQSHGSGYSGRPIYLTEPAPPVDALRLVLLARHAKVNALESGEASSSKSFWVHHDANLVTHLFGSKGRPGRLHQELRDWLRRKARKSAGSIELQEYHIAAVVATDNLLTEAEFEDIDWQQLLPKRAAMPLNIAIIKAHKVYDLSGLRLRNFLADQGLRPPSASALRQRWRYLKKLLASRR